MSSLNFRVDRHSQTCRFLPSQVLKLICDNSLHLNLIRKANNVFLRWRHIRKTVDNLILFLGTDVLRYRWAWPLLAGCHTDLWGCLGGAERSSGTGRMDRRHTPAAGSAWGGWSRSAAAPPSFPSAAVTPLNPSPRSRKGWTLDVLHFLLLLFRLLLVPLLLQFHLHHPLYPGCPQSGRSATGRRAAW